MLRHGEVICIGTIEAMHNLERTLKGNRVVHDGSKGKHDLLGDYTPRSAFSRVYEVPVNNYRVRITFWYDRRDGTARVRALPNDMSLLKNNIPDFGNRLWVVAKSGENVTEKTGAAAVHPVPVS